MFAQVRITIAREIANMKCPVTDNDNQLLPINYYIYLSKSALANVSSILSKNRVLIQNEVDCFIWIERNIARNSSTRN